MCFHGVKFTFCKKNYGKKLQFIRKIAIFAKNPQAIMRFGNFHIGFINDKSVVVREVVLNPAYTSFVQFEPISQILDKIRGGFESLNYYSNYTNVLGGLSEAEVRRFMQNRLFSIYLNEYIQGEVFLNVTEQGQLYISDKATRYVVTNPMFQEFGTLQSTMLEHAIKHYEQTINVDIAVLEQSGMEGIISPQSNSFNGGLADDDVVDKLEGELNKNGLNKPQKKYIVTNTPYQITQPKNELATLDFTGKQKQTFLTLCDKFGCPKELFAVSDQSTYENRRLAKIDFYNNTILPYANKVLEQINRLQQDITDKADTFYIARNEIAELAREDRDRQDAGRAMVEALMKLHERGVITTAEVRKNIEDIFYLSDENK